MQKHQRNSRLKPKLKSQQKRLQKSLHKLRQKIQQQHLQKRKKKQIRKCRKKHQFRSPLNKKKSRRIRPSKRMYLQHKAMIKIMSSDRGSGPGPISKSLKVSYHNEIPHKFS